MTLCVMFYIPLIFNHGNITLRLSQHELARVEKGGAQAKVDSARYEGLPPVGALESDLQVRFYLLHEVNNSI